MTNKGNNSGQPVVNPGGLYDSTTIYSNNTGMVSTLAGNGQMGWVDGPGSSAEFNDPIAITVDASGNAYVLDNGPCVIRKITPSGVVSTFAGNGTCGYVDGPGNAAEFQYFNGITIDGGGNLYVCEGLGGIAGNRIRIISPQGTVSTYAGNDSSGNTNGAGNVASFSNPLGLVFQNNNSTLYVADAANNEIRSVVGQPSYPSSKQEVYDWAGTGTAGLVNGPLLQSEFFGPTALAIDNDNSLYVADFYNSSVRLLFNNLGVLSAATWAGNDTMGFRDGATDTAEFVTPNGLAVDAQFNLYVTSGYPAQQADGRIRVIKLIGSDTVINGVIIQEPSTVFVNTLAGSISTGFADGPLKTALFGFPVGIALAGPGILYIVDEPNLRIREIVFK